MFPSVMVGEDEATGRGSEANLKYNTYKLLRKAAGLGILFIVLRLTVTAS